LLATDKGKKMAPVNFSVGDRVIHTNWMYGTESMGTIQHIGDPVECGGVFKGEVEAVAIVRFAAGTIAHTPLRSLKPYETPKYPPGVIPAKFYLDCPLEEIGEVEDYIMENETPGGSRENAIKEEMNENDMASILSGESRDTALLGIDPKDMDDFEDMCNMREEYHRLIAKSPQGGRDDSSVAHNMEMGNRLYERNAVLRNRIKTSTEGVEELDSKDRIMVEATMKKKGKNYMSATTKYGALYIDLKYTKYVPKIGEKFKCVMGIKGPTGNLPWKCYRIV
jgi:hypothetical protein